MQQYPERALLEGLEIQILKLVSSSATPEQWKEWLRVPLEHATARGNIDLFNKLLGAGANGAAGWKGCDGRTMLDAAARGGNEEVVSGLLRAGARPDVNVVSVSSGRSALYTATVIGHEAVAKALIVAGADVNFEDPVDKRSVLHAAVSRGHQNLVKDLMISGANSDSGDENGHTLLHVAAGKGHDGIVSALLLRDADKDALTKNGKTPLMWASRRGRVCVVEILLAAGADFNIRGNDTYSALDLAATNGHVPVLQTILDGGADVNNGCDEGYTALHMAAEHDQAGAVHVLIAAGAGIELKNSDGSTPLVHAARYSKIKATHALLQHGAKLSARDSDGDTALHVACCFQRKGLDAAVDLLLRWGADETALNNTDKCPADGLDAKPVCIDNPSTRFEIERTRLLLSRAPADRARRCRGWLVVLRSRAGKARAAMSCGGRAGTTNYPSAAGGPREGEGGKAVRREGTGSGGGDHVVRRQASSGGEYVGDGDGDRGVFSRAMKLLVGLEPEDVFRTVLSFL